MTCLRRFAISVLMLICLIAMVCAQEKSAEQIFDGKALPKLAGGDWRYRVETVSVKGKPFDHYAQIYGSREGFITFDIRAGWDWMTGSLGVSDDLRNAAGTITFELDNTVVQTLTFQSGAEATPFKIALTGHQTLTIRRSAGMAYFLDPKLVRGQPMPQSQDNNPSTTPSATAATFVVDPNDLDKLAGALRKQVDAKPELKARIAAGQIALSTFLLIEIPAPSVAVNVAENLSTALIKNDFSLVERAQLDKAMKELKMQDSGAFDPTSVQKLGKLTGCDIILVGSISDQGLFVVINARFLDTATGKALAAEKVEMRKIAIRP